MQVADLVLGHHTYGIGRKQPFAIVFAVI
jgi:hypothetical protein